MKKCYAGIGSRNTPKKVLNIMKKIACQLEIDGYGLRSGGCQGPDISFESGVSDEENKKIFSPKTIDWKEDNSWSFETAEKYSLGTSFKKWKDYTKKLYARNMMIILGKEGKEPVDFVVCWTETKNYDTYGGTNHAVRCAKDNDIPVYNLYIKKDIEEFKNLLEKIKK